MPLSFLMGCSGINSIRFLYTNTWIFWPDLMPIDSRTSLGITTWYLGETVTVRIPVKLATVIPDLFLPLQPEQGFEPLLNRFAFGLQSGQF
jgi:hypothetical protein